MNDFVAELTQPGYIKISTNLLYDELFFDVHIMVELDEGEFGRRSAPPAQFEPFSRWHLRRSLYNPIWEEVRLQLRAG